MEGTDKEEQRERQAEEENYTDDVTHETLFFFFFCLSACFFANVAFCFLSPLRPLSLFGAAA